jgi:preprotein translocase subunit SecE
VAQSKRRRGRDADDDLDEVLDDPVDDLDDIDDEDEDEPVARRRGGTATKVRPVTRDTVDRPQVRSDEHVGIFGRMLRFLREVVAELRKVIWPTRKELLTYATVVVVFVAVIVTIVALLDTGFAWAVLKIFGGPSK